MDLLVDLDEVQAQLGVELLRNVLAEEAGERPAGDRDGQHDRRQGPEQQAQAQRAPHRPPERDAGAPHAATMR